MSLQIAILKVLASYPRGRATVSAIKADLAILAGAGSDWSARLKRLAARLPDLDIFSQGLYCATPPDGKLQRRGSTRCGSWSFRHRAIRQKSRRPSSSPKRLPSFNWLRTNLIPKLFHSPPRSGGGADTCCTMTGGVGQRLKHSQLAP